MPQKDDEIILLRQKLIDISVIVCKLKAINNLLLPFADENWMEGIIISELFSKEIETLNKTVEF